MGNGKPNPIISTLQTNDELMISASWERGDESVGEQSAIVNCDSARTMVRALTYHAA